MPTFANLARALGEKLSGQPKATAAPIPADDELIIPGFEPSSAKSKSKSKSKSKLRPKRGQRGGKKPKPRQRTKEELIELKRQVDARDGRLPYVKGARSTTRAVGTDEAHDAAANDAKLHLSRSKNTRQARASMMGRAADIIAAAKLLYHIGDKIDVRIGPFGLEVRRNQRGNWVKGGVYQYLARSSRAAETEANPWLRGGKYAPTKILPGRVHDAVEALIDQNANLAQDLVEGLNGMTIDAFEGQMVGLIRQSVLQGLVLGAGGPGNFTLEHQAMFQDMVGVELQYLSSFVDELRQDVEAGRTIGAKAQNRAASYAGIAYAAYTQGMRQSAANELDSDASDNPGGAQERRVLGEAEHCDDCVAYADMGWQPIGSLPGIGDSQCGNNCRCSFEYREATEAEADSDEPEIGQADVPEPESMFDSAIFDEAGQEEMIPVTESEETPPPEEPAQEAEEEEVEEGEEEADPVDEDDADEEENTDIIEAPQWARKMTTPDTQPPPTPEAPPRED